MPTQKQRGERLKKNYEALSPEGKKRMGKQTHLNYHYVNQVGETTGEEKPTKPPESEYDATVRKDTKEKTSRSGRAVGDRQFYESTPEGDLKRGTRKQRNYPGKPRQDRIPVPSD